MLVDQNSAEKPEWANAAASPFSAKSLLMDVRSLLRLAPGSG